MSVNLGTIVLAALCILSGAGAVYLACALFAIEDFRRRPLERSAATPPLTIFKPVCGLEPELFENLCSFCDQEYPVFQVLFGVCDESDPAIPVIRRVIERFPERDLALVVDGRRTVANGKVANLINMQPRAKHAIFVIADADMRVTPAYLQAIAAPFEDARTGAVTCLYGGRPARAGSGGSALSSRLAAHFINEQFAPSVLVAQRLEPLRYCFGATMAVRKATLDAVGGFAALGAHIGDDYVLGQLVALEGGRVVLSRYVVVDVIEESSLRSLWEHELRWARTIRAARPFGYASSVITFPLPFAFAAACFAPASGRGALLLCGALFVTVLALRSFVQRAAQRAFADCFPAGGAWAVIGARDLLSLCVWAASFLGASVRWRGERLTLQDGGALDHIERNA